MIELARLSRGINRSELAELTNISQSNISRMELGHIGISDQAIDSISKALNYPLEFFTQKINLYPPNIHYRKREIISQKILQKADALMNIYRIHIEEMLKNIELSIENIPVISKQEKCDTPEKVAEFIRSYWKVPKGAILNLTQIIEANGIIVIQLDFGTDMIDGRSMMTETGHPIIFVNKHSSGDRMRMTIAHELGHIIMHLKTIPTFARDEEEEAFRFASEFLMPYNEIKHEFSDKSEKLSIGKLSDMKRKWKVSMQAILNWAEKNNCITKNQSRYLWSQIISLGMRKKEPIEIPKEDSTLINRMVNIIMESYEYSKNDMASIFKINLSEFEERFFGNSQNVKLRIA